MGPGDEPIEGQITVHVKDRETNEDVPNGQLTLTVKLEVPKDEYMINDVMIKHELYSENSPSEDNGWIYIMDRNLGCDARMTEEDGIVRKNEAMWCFYDGPNYAGEDERAWIITNTTNSNMKENPTKWLGNLDFPINISHRYEPTTTHYSTWKSILKNQYKHLGRMYEDADSYPWQLMTSYTVPSIRKNTAISKGRHFILADEEVCPIKNGKKVRVACWLPSGCRIGYAFVTVPGTQFAKKVLLCSNRGNMTHADFWPNNVGYYDGGDAYYSIGRLIRLMYMVGYVKDSRGNAISAEYTLSKDREKEELEYYKEHILKCYEQ